MVFQDPPVGFHVNWRECKWEVGGRGLQGLQKMEQANQPSPSGFLLGKTKTAKERRPFHALTCGSNMAFQESGHTPNHLLQWPMSGALLTKS